MSDTYYDGAIVSIMQRLSRERADLERECKDVTNDLAVRRQLQDAYTCLNTAILHLRAANLTIAGLKVTKNQEEQNVTTNHKPAT